ncbi:MAG: ATP-binding protein [Actinomycetota bacterium]|nr:ATP-binding protein [Actinomycetota bacterium]
MTLHHRHALRRATRGATAPGGEGGGLLGPHAVVVRPRHLAVGDGVCRSFAVVGYPREVGYGWLAPLLEHPGRLDVALHVEPVRNDLAAERLRRQQARLESARRVDAAKGRLSDPGIEVAAQDAAELSGRLARGQAKLFRLGLYLTVHAPDPDALEAECARVKALVSSLLLDAVPATFRSLQGFVTTLPVGIDNLSMRRTLDTDAVAAAFPFSGVDLAGAGGVLYGTTLSGSGLVCWDRFALDNHNSVILARSGAGKSYLAKLEALRSLYDGVEVFVVDPEDEYRRLAHAVGGAYLHLGASGVRLNPFDLAPGPDPLTRRALFIHTLVAVLLGEKPDPAATAALDRGVLAAYAAVGITADPRTHARPAPVLADLTKALEADPDPAATTLAARLAPYVTGSYRQLFCGPTTTRPEGHLVVISLRDLPDELKAAGTLLTLDAVWRRVADPATRKRRLVVVDEAWLLMRDPEGAKFLFKAAKSARKHWAGLTVVTQDAADLLGSDLGQAVVANAATQILLRQAPQAIEAVGDAFGLSQGERAFLVSARRGEGLLSTAAHERVGFCALASPAEHDLVTSSPAELAGLDDSGDDLDL